MKHLLLLLLFPVVCFGQGDQTIINVPIDNSGTTEKAILHLPDDYGKSTTKYPIMVFLHGIGEGGTNPASIYGNSNSGGPAYWISQGKFPSSFVNPADKKTYKYIVISPQSDQGWSTTAPQLDVVLSYLIKTYRIDESRLYLTGLSAGGEGVVEYCGQILSSGLKIGPTHPIAAVIPMSAVMNAVYEPVYATTIFANKVKLWGFGSPSDTHGANTLGLIYYLNLLLGNYATQTSYSGGHCCWGQFYDPSFKQGGMSIYEWALQYTQGTSAPSSPTDGQPTDPPPVTPTQFTIPGKIEADGYAAMSGIATESTSDAGGGKDVGWVDQGDWMNYSVNVTSAGKYTASFRIATPNTGATFQVTNASGAVLATVSLPNTGGYQNWQTVTADLTLPVGASTIYLKSTGAAGWNINWMQFSPVVTGPSNPTGTIWPVPGKIEAEKYSTMGGVQTENTPDAGAGQDVGWIDEGDYMDYNVNVASAGQYTVSFRIATPEDGAVFQVTLANGTVLSTVNVPNTGGFQNWQTTTATLTLPVGPSTLRIKSTGSAMWNINWMQFDSGASAPPSGSGAAIPGKIEAETYSQWNGVGTETTLDAGGGQDVGGIDPGDWMDYVVNVKTAGQYTVSFRVATPFSNVSVQMLSNGSALTTFKPGNTGGWQTWQTYTTTVTLAAGQQTLRLLSTSAANLNINWMQFDLASSGPTAPTTGSVIPSKVEAETYTKWSGVGTESTLDAGGGQDVAGIDQGDWMEYSVNVTAAGAYTVSFRIATPLSGTSIQILSNGNVVGTIQPGNPGGWQTWGTYSTTINLPAGQQTLRIVSNAGAQFNFNWMQFTSGTTAASMGVSATSAKASVLGTDAAGMSQGALAGIALYPNPLHDQLNIQMNNTATGAMLVQITDAAGVVRSVSSYSKTSSNIQVSVNTANLSAGIYFVRIQVGNVSEVRKIVKQ